MVAEFFNQENMQRFPQLIEVGLIVIIAWLFSGWVVLYDQHSENSSFDFIDSGPLREGADVHLIVSTSLFGIEQDGGIKVDSSKLALPSKLNIKLVGTVVSDDRRAVAIVIVPGRPKQQVFHIGDSVQAGVVVYKIEADAVIVNHHGKFERIAIKKGKAIAGMSRRVVDSGVRSPSLSVQHRVLRRNVLNDGLENFPVLLTQALATPHMNQGKIDGFTISKIVPGSLYETIGLKNGDIVRKVNGQAITNAAQAMQMYQNLKNAQSIDLELGRDGANVPIHYDIQ